MIPLVAVISLRGRQSRTVRLWVPLFLLWVLMVPLAVLLSPVIFVGLLVCRVNPLRAFSVAWQVLCALNDAEFEFEQRSAGISICVF
jgi:hypothetical protein